MTDLSKVSNAELLTFITKLQSEKQALQAKVDTTNKIRFKVSAEKGALSVYGLNNRFPVTMYVQQWERLIAQLPALQAFMRDNASSLTRKA